MGSGRHAASDARPPVAVELDVEVGGVACRATLPALTAGLPAGTWRIATQLSSRPAPTAPEPTTSVRTARLDEAGELRTEPMTLRVYRSADAVTTVRASVVVEREEDGGWIAHSDAAAEVELDPFAPRPVPPRWGANLHIYIPGDRPPGSLDVHLDRMASIGMELVRTGVPWSILCPTSDAFDETALAQADAFFDGCAARGLRAIPIIDAHAPSWAVGDRPKAPASWDAYTAFVSRCLDRWGHSFAAVVTQNEPNHTEHVNDFTPDLVVAATRAARAALAGSAHGDLPLLGPGIAFGDAAYLAQLLDAGIGELVDGIACHPYGIRFDIDTPHFREPERPWGDPAGDPHHLASGVQVLVDLLRSRGLEVPIWVNEYGCSTSRTGPDGGLGGLDVTEEVQARWLATAVGQAAAIPEVAALCIYMFHDNPWKVVAARFADVDPHDRTWQACFGLVSHDGSCDKPALRAVANAIAAASRACG